MKIPATLPKLIGTEKQVTWAETIRGGMIKYIDVDDIKAAIINHCTGKPAKMEVLKKWTERNVKISNTWIETKAAAAVSSIRNSSWFIDNRFDRQALYYLAEKTIERELGIA